MQTEEKEMTENEKKKEYLRQYRIHVRRIHRINAEIAELRSMKISPSMNNDGMPHGSSQGDLSGYAAELDRMVSELIKERYVRMVEYQEIVRQIKRLRSENEKDVLFYRYIRGITNTTPTIEFQVKDTDSGVNAGTIVVTVDGTAVSTVTKTAIDGGYKCTCTSPTLKDGSHTISVKASDNDGNAAAAKTATFTVDTVPPTLQITAPSNDLITNKKTVTVSGKTDDVSSKSVTVTVSGVTVTVGTDGTFTKDETLVEGANTITIVAKDKAGKTTTVTRKVTVDTSAPVIKSVTLTRNPVDCGKTFIIAVEITD